MKRCLLVGAILFVQSVGLPYSAGAQQIPHAQDRPPGPPLSPAEAVAKMTVPEGFTVEIVAAEPQIVNPVSMTFDERGRIWVTESFEYPRHEPGPGRDRIKILEDTDHDGGVDKVTVFMEGLNIPSGIAVGYGGVWVVNSPDILFVQDTDGDGKADKQEVVVTGFGRTDTHELPNSLTWGPDGWLYGLNGVFNHSHVRYPEGSSRAHEKPDGWKLTCAMFRIHPRTREFQVFAEGTSNPWGIAFDNEGSAFISACVIDHLWHIVETGYYHRQGGPYPPFTWKIDSIVKHKHQKAAYCGIHFFDSDAYPEKYREKLYMGNIHGNCINVDKLQRDGSTYFATGDPDFLSANDAWFMPVVQKTGPDGCLYVLDWYDQYHCYQDANRDPAGIDRGKGRLYRVRYKETPRAPAFDLAKESDDQLIERLKSPNVFFRDMAQRVLTERSNTATSSKLQRMVFDDAVIKKSRMHALWTLLSSQQNAPFDFYLDLLRRGDASIASWAIRAVGNLDLNRFFNMRDISSIAISGADGLSPALASPEVLLQAAITSGKYKEDESQITILLSILSRCGNDKLIPRVVWANLHPLIERRPNFFLSQLGNWPRGQLPAPIAALLPRISERILAKFDSNPHIVADLLQRLEQCDTNAACQCLSQISTSVQNAEIRGEPLQNLRKYLDALISAHLTSGANDPLALDAAILATSWGDARAVELVRPALAAPDASATLRLRALGALIAGRDSSLFASLPKMLSTPFKNSPGDGNLSDAEFRGHVLAALGKLDDPQVAGVVLSAYRQLPPDVQPKAVELLTQRAAWAKQLLAAIGDKQISADVLNLNQVRKLVAMRDNDLSDSVQKLWGTIREGRNPGRDAVIAEMRGLIRRTPGDAHRGQEVFKKVCGQCHKIYGEGEDVGPDITLNGRNSYDQLLSNVFDPSLVIGAAYQPRTVVTKQGRVVTGLLVEESDQRVALKIQGGKQEVIPRSDIDEMVVSELSLMPEDLEKTLKPQEISDLFAFITLDKPPADKSARRLSGVDRVVQRDTDDPAQFAEIVGEVAPGFTLVPASASKIALRRLHFGRPAVLRTHPRDAQTAAVLTSTVELPAGRKSHLRLSVSHDNQGDWQLIVKANDKTLYDEEISQQSTEGGWLDLSLDLSEFAGQTTKIELHNHPDEWANEFGFWGRVEIVTE